MLKTIEAIIDTQNEVHWQEPPPIQGECLVLITILEELPKDENTLTLMQRWQNLRKDIPDEWEDIDPSTLRDRSN